MITSLRLTASRPEIHSRAASLFFFASSFSSALSSSSLSRLFAVAVVRFVVDDDDALEAHQLVGDTRCSIWPSFSIVSGGVAAALEQ